MNGSPTNQGQASDLGRTEGRSKESDISGVNPVEKHNFSAKLLGFVQQKPSIRTNNTSELETSGLIENRLQCMLCTVRVDESWEPCFGQMEMMSDDALGLSY